MIRISGIRVSSSLFVLGLAICFCGSPDLIVKASAQAQQGPAIELPKTQLSGLNRYGLDDKSVVLAIASDDEFFIGNEKIKKEKIPERIRNLIIHLRSEDQKVFIKSSASVKYSTVKEMLTIIRQEGVDAVGFVVENRDTSRAEIFNARIYTLPFAPPQARPGNTAPVVEPEPAHMKGLVVEVKTQDNGPDRVIALNSRIMTLSDLGLFLSNFLEQTYEKTVFIKVSRDRMYGDLIAVMDEVIGANADPVGLIINEVEVPRTMPLPKSPPGNPGGVPVGVPGGVPIAGPERVFGRVPDNTLTIRRAGYVLQGSATHRVEPKYPPLAQAAGVSGEVIVEVVVDEEGNVYMARAVTGHPLLRDAAVAAAREWKFTPIKLEGVPVKVIGTITFNFHK